MRNPRPWIIQRRLAEAAQKLLAKIYVWLQITVFTENDERRLARIGENSILNQTKQPIGQIGRKISVETQTAPSRACTRIRLTCSIRLFMATAHAVRENREP